MVIDLKENTGSGKIGKLIDKAAELFRNRIIVAGLLLYQGMIFLIDPQKAPSKMASSAGLTILIAAAGILIGYITTGTFNRENRLHIAEALGFTALGAAMIIFSGVFALAIREIISICLITNGLHNLAGLIRRKEIDTTVKAHRPEPKGEVAGEVIKAVREDIREQNKGLIAQANKLLQKASGLSVGQALIDLGMIIAGLSVMFIRLRLNKLGIRTMGGFMIGSALNDIILAARAAVISRRTRAAKEKQLSEGELI